MLKNIRVIDLTMHLSGPYCCWLLASMGADVIKVERPDGGDPVRETGPFVDEQSLYYGSINRGKRSIVIDLKSDDGKAVFRKLVETADVLVENFRAGVLDRLGFSDATLRDINPRLVHASITGFGQKGSFAKRPAFDVVLQGMSGLMSMTGSPSGQPTLTGISLADVTTGVFAALSVVARLFEREKTGEAGRSDIAMLDCQMALLENAFARVLNSEEMPARVGNRHPKIAPFQAFQTQDHPIVVAADGERNWQAMCGALGLDHLIEDPLFYDNYQRVANSEQLDAVLGPIFAARPSAEILHTLAAADVPCGPVNSVSEALEMPPVIERGLISEVINQHGRVLRFISSPVGRDLGIKDVVAPTLGQHTVEILNELNHRS